MKLRVATFPFLLLTLTLVNPCRQSQSARLPTQGDKVFEVTVTRPSFKQVPNELEVSGKVEGAQITPIAASVAAVVDKVHVKVGDVVEKNADLVTLSGEDLADVIDVKNLKIKELEARIKVVESKIKTTSDTSASPSIEDTSFLDDDFDKPEIEKQKDYGDQSDMPQDPTTLGDLEKLLQAMKDRFAREVSILEKRRLALVQKAPLGGIVTDIKVNEQDKVGEGQVLLEISVLNPISINFELTQEYASAVDQTSQVRVVSTSSDLAEGLGKVSFVAPNISPVTKTFEVKALVNNENSRFKGGQVVKVFIATRRMNLAFTLPQKAIGTVDGKNVIATVQGQQAHFVPVKTGRVFKNGQILVIADVSVDSQIVTEIPEDLQNGNFVKVKENVFLEEPEELKEEKTMQDSQATPSMPTTPEPTLVTPPPAPSVPPSLDPPPDPKKKPVEKIQKIVLPEPNPVSTPPSPPPLEEVIDGY